MKWIDRKRWMGRKSGIYEIRCGSRFYVGSAVWLSRRFRQHRHLLESGKHPNPILQNCWNKYGTAEFRVLVVCDEENLLDYEQRFLDRYVGTPGCCNIGKDAVATRRGVKMPLEVVERVSDHNRGRKQGRKQKERRRQSRALSGPEKGKGYKGVSYDKARGKWIGQIRICPDTKKKKMRRFDTAEEAAAWYNQEALKLWGEGNCYLNPVDVEAPPERNSEEVRALKARSIALGGPRNGRRYKGTRKVPSGKFAAQLRRGPGDRVHIGTFDTEEEAALAYNKAAIEHYGEGNCYLNEVP